jgi:hypothetical protein
MFPLFAPKRKWEWRFATLHFRPLSAAPSTTVISLTNPLRTGGRASQSHGRAAT